MTSNETPSTAFHTAVTVLAQAILLPAEEQVPWVNRVAQLAAPVGDEGDQKAWLKMRSKMHDAIRKVTNIAQQLTEHFEDFELQNPASVRQLDLFPSPIRRNVPFMGDSDGGTPSEEQRPR